MSSRATVNLNTRCLCTPSQSSVAIRSRSAQRTKGSSKTSLGESRTATLTQVSPPRAQLARAGPTLAESAAAGIEPVTLARGGGDVLNVDLVQQYLANPADIVRDYPIVIVLVGYQLITVAAQTYYRGELQRAKEACEAAGIDCRDLFVQPGEEQPSDPWKGEVGQYAKPKVGQAKNMTNGRAIQMMKERIDMEEFRAECQQRKINVRDITLANYGSEHKMWVEFRKRMQG